VWREAPERRRKTMPGMERWIGNLALTGLATFLYSQWNVVV
jgi:hypothetical protein